MAKKKGNEKPSLVPGKGGRRVVEGWDSDVQRSEMLVISLRLRKSRILVLSKMFKTKRHYLELLKGCTRRVILKNRRHVRFKVIYVIGQIKLKASP